MTFSEQFLEEFKTFEYDDALHKLWRNKEGLEDDPFVVILGKEEKEKRVAEYMRGLDMLFDVLCKSIYDLLGKYYLLFGKIDNIKDFKEYIANHLIFDLCILCKDNTEKLPGYNEGEGLGLLKTYNKKLRERFEALMLEINLPKLEYLVDNITSEDLSSDTRVGTRTVEILCYRD